MNYDSEGQAIELCRLICTFVPDALCLFFNEYQESETNLFIAKVESGRRGGLVVERRTQKPEEGGLILTQVAVLYT